MTWDWSFSWSTIVVLAILLWVVGTDIFYKKFRPVRPMPVPPYTAHLTQVEVVTDPNTNTSILVFELAIKKREGSGYWTGVPQTLEINGVVETLGKAWQYDFRAPTGEIELANPNYPSDKE